MTYALTEDDRLPRKVLQLFDWSRLPEGLTQSRYPSRIRQMIPPFSLWWVAMVSDYLLWRGDPAFVRSLLPGVRAVLDAFTHLRGADGLVRSPEGWNYVDWVPAWESGIPPAACPAKSAGPSTGSTCWPCASPPGWKPTAATTNWPCAGSAWRSRPPAPWRSATGTTARGLYADDAAHTIFTEHSQCLAVLSGLIPAQHQDEISAQPVQRR